MRGNNFLARVLCLSAAFMCFFCVMNKALAEEFKCMEMEFEDVRSMAQEGNEVAQFCLANLYYGGRVVDQNIIEAEKLYVKLAEKGHAGALNTLSSIYMNGALNLDGTGIRKDKEKGLALRKKAAEAGHPRAMENLAMVYMYDRNDPQGLDKAVELLTKAANKGNLHAANRLGGLYYEGHRRGGVTILPVNKEKALFWYEKAAAAGQEFSFAQSRVNEMKGLSPDTNIKEKKSELVYIKTASEKEDFFELNDFSEYLEKDRRSCTRAGYSFVACSCDLKDEYLEMEALLQEAAENHPEWVGSTLRFRGLVRNKRGEMVKTSMTTTWGVWNIELERYKKYACSRED